MWTFKEARDNQVTNSIGKMMCFKAAMMTALRALGKPEESVDLDSFPYSDPICSCNNTQKCVDIVTYLQGRSSSGGTCDYNKVVKWCKKNRIQAEFIPCYPKMVSTNICEWLFNKIKLGFIPIVVCNMRKTGDGHFFHAMVVFNVDVENKYVHLTNPVHSCAESKLIKLLNTPALTTVDPKDVKHHLKYTTNKQIQSWEPQGKWKDVKKAICAKVNKPITIPLPDGSCGGILLVS